MEQLDFTKWGVQKIALYDDDGIALLSSPDDEENGELFNVAHSLLVSGKDYSLFHFAGKKMLFSKDTDNRLLICTIVNDSPSMKAVHFLPEMHRQIAEMLKEK